LRWHRIIGGSIIAWLLGITLIGGKYILSIQGDIQAVQGDVKAIKQSAKDHGGEIVQDIENPKTTEQQAANLSLAAAQLKVATAENRPPNEGKLLLLQKAIAKQSTEHPELPETWQAAVQLVNYKFRSTSPLVSTLPNCLSLPVGSPTLDNSIDAGGPLTAEFAIIECSFDLDDDGNFPATPLGKVISTFRATTRPFPS
jgi:hypothetical protein